MRWPPRWVAAVLVLLGVALVAVPLSFELRRTPAHTLDVEFLNRIDFALLRQAFPHPDLMNGLVLAAGCGMAVMAAAVAIVPELRRFFVATAVLLGAVAVEETFEISEAIAEPLGIPPRPTDLFLPFLMAAFFFVYRRLFLSSRRAVILGAVGAAVFALSLVLDTVSATLGRFEDPLESVASLLLLTGFALLALELIAGRARQVTMETA